jgi:hypothetical protein
MTITPPPAPPAAPPEEPSNRWPWVALLLGVLVVLAAVVFFFFSRPRSGELVVEGTPTGKPVAIASVSPPPTLVPPTPPTSAPLPPTQTSVLPSPTAQPSPSPTRVATPSPPPAAAAPAATPSQPAAAATPAQPAANPQTTPGAPVATGGPIVASPQPAQPPAVTQVAGPGGLGNTRSDFDAAYGAPVGETPEHLVVYRKSNVEYHVSVGPEPTSRAALITAQPQQSGQTFALDQAMVEARKLLPRDVQPPNPQPEGNDRFVVERFTSQSLAQALGDAAFGGAQAGQMLAVYVRDPAQQGRITRIVVGPGSDPQALLNAAGR